MRNLVSGDIYFDTCIDLVQWGGPLNEEGSVRVVVSCPNNADEQLLELHYGNRGMLSTKGTSTLLLSPSIHFHARV